MVGKGIVERALRCSVVQHIDDTTVQIVEVTRLSVLGDTLVAVSIERGADGSAIVTEYGLPAFFVRAVGEAKRVALSVVIIRNCPLGSPAPGNLGQTFKGIVGKNLCRRAHTRALQQIGRIVFEIIGHAVQSAVVVPL